MNTRITTFWNGLHLRPAWVALALALVMLACALQTSSTRTFEKVPPERWQKQRGPVVPHDTFPRDCSLCHAGSSWHEIKPDFHFDHEQETGVALRGAHAGAECLRCHNDRGPVALFARQGCAGCHEDVHRGKLGKNCADCHDENDWRALETIAQHAKTRFPLVGSHAATACFACHPGAQVGNFERASIECVDCHRDDLRQATSPDHAEQGWTSGCDRCHIPTSWAGAGFNHGFFPLEAGHSGLTCVQCHADGQFSGTPTQCNACHQDDFDGTRDPDHSAAGFGTSCQRCHDTSTWENANWVHPWPLTGAHLALGCASCHPSSTFGGEPTNCAGCHLDDYQQTTDPDHRTSGFPTTCEQCHNTNSWERATFSHRGISNGCVQCHLGDYNQTTDPNHAAAGFPTSCEICHDTSNWENARFDHDFPIDNGPHSALSCQQCHNMPRNFRNFTCTNCHEHLRDDMDDEHDDVRRYVYESNACLNCHPNGRER